MMLAASPWPRTGIDPANRALSALKGPAGGDNVQLIDLHSASGASSNRRLPAGVVVMPDRSLRAMSEGGLTALSRQGVRLWDMDLPLPRGSANDTPWFSMPVVLSDTSMVLTTRRAVIRVRNHHDVSVFATEHRLDNSLSPNLLSNGAIVLSSPFGSILTFRDGSTTPLGRTGYGMDIQIPAIFADSSLAVAGYAGHGLCRVDLDGSVRWATDHKYFDLLPTIDFSQSVACGSLNGKFSGIFAPDGHQIGEYGHPALFAVHPRHGWVALAPTRISALDRTGREIWGHGLVTHLSSGSNQPIVDGAGHVYVRHQEGILCIADTGRVIFNIHVEFAEAAPLSITDEGTLALIAHNQLVLVR